MSELDDVFNAAHSLEPDDRLRLIARLWASLPAEHWAAPNANELAELRRRLDDVDMDGIAEVPWKIVRQFAGNRPAAIPARIYSAPRRFDLATIFVVTVAYSLLFAAMSGLRLPPEASLMIGGFITLVGFGQAVLFRGIKPRLASVVVGSATCFLWTFGFMLMYGPPSFPGARVFFGLWAALWGCLAGYVAGVLVGGVFLVADLLRQKVGRRAKLADDEALDDAAD